VVEWIKAVPPVIYPANATAINQVLQTHFGEAIAGKKSVRDAAGAIAREVTPLLQAGA
jgi:hypothetical protein